MKIPLQDVIVKCAKCGETCSGQDLNDENPAFHDPVTGAQVRLPSFGITEQDQRTLAGMGLLCELCHEEEMEL